MTSEEDKEQFKIRLPAATREALESTAVTLGFFSSNALVATFANELAGVPAQKVWEVLAEIRRYHPVNKRNIKSPK